MNYKTIVIAGMLALSSLAARAEEAKPADELTGNLSVVSDYRYRGLSQTRLQPALQGGGDYVDNRNGWYMGIWGSTISWTRDAGGGGSFEIDVYGGKRGNLGKASYDVGVLTYIYPDNSLGHVKGLANASTTEIYGQLGFGGAYVKYSHALTNTFAYMDSKGSGYLDLGYSVDWQGNTVSLHVGHQTIRHAPAGTNYSDYKIGVTRNVGIVDVSLAVVGTNAKRSVYTGPNGKYLGKTTVVASVGKTF